MNDVLCPHCGKSFEINQALKHQFEEDILREERSKHKNELAKVTEKIQLETEKRIKEELELKLKDTANQAQEEKEKNMKLKEELLEQNKAIRELKNKEEDLKKEMLKKLEEGEKEIRLEAQKKAEEEQHLKLMAKDKQLQDTLKELEDAKRKLQQGSQQMQGEVFELEFETLLKTEFPHDKISPVGKGVKGGDIVHEVWDARGNYNGKILWELKNTKTWTAGWVDKLKGDKRTIKADEAVIITEVLPSTIKTAGYYDGIWVTKQTFVIGLASALRASLIQVYYTKQANKGKDEKVEVLYSYLSGIEFKHRIEAIIEAFSNMQTDIEKEKRYFSTKWARDEKNIRQVIDNTFGMHGDFKGIMGNTLPTIKGLESGDLLDSGE